MEDKVILMKFDRGDNRTTLAELLGIIKEFQERYPDMEIFWDGDEYAICGRKKRAHQDTLDSYAPP